MRPVIAVLIWISLIGGLAGYMRARSVSDTRAETHVERVKESYSLDIRSTLDLAPDPFALDVVGGPRPAALLISVNGRETLRDTEVIQAGVVKSLGPLEGLTRGANEIYVEASPPFRGVGLWGAVRIRVFRGPVQIAERTYWTEGGQKVAGAFVLTLDSDEDGGGSDDH